METDLKIVLRAIVDEFDTPGTDRTARAFTAEIQHAPNWHGRSPTVCCPRSEGVRAASSFGPRRGTDPHPTPTWVRRWNSSTAPLHHRWLLRLEPFTHDHADILVDILVDTVLGALRS